MAFNWSVDNRLIPAGKAIATGKIENNPEQENTSTVEVQKLVETRPAPSPGIPGFGGQIGILTEADGSIAQPGLPIGLKELMPDSTRSSDEKKLSIADVNTINSAIAETEKERKIRKKKEKLEKKVQAKPIVKLIATKEEKGTNSWQPME